MSGEYAICEAHENRDCIEPECWPWPREAVRAEPIDFAAIKAEHEGHAWDDGTCWPREEYDSPELCLVYRLAVEAQRLTQQAESFVLERDAWRETSGTWRERAEASQRLASECFQMGHLNRIADLTGEREDALAEVERLAGKVARYQTSTERWSIVGTWLVEATDEHNCGTGPDGHYGAHESMCGYEPVVNLATLQGFAALADQPEQAQL